MYRKETLLYLLLTAHILTLRWTTIYKRQTNEKSIVNDRDKKRKDLFCSFLEKAEKNKQPTLNPRTDTLSPPSVHTLEANRAQRLLLFEKNTPLCISLHSASLSLSLSLI